MVNVYDHTGLWQHRKQVVLNFDQAGLTLIQIYDHTGVNGRGTRNLSGLESCIILSSVWALRVILDCLDQFGPLWTTLQLSKFY